MLTACAWLHAHFVGGLGCPSGGNGLASTSARGEAQAGDALCYVWPQGAPYTSEVAMLFTCPWGTWT